MVAFKRIRKNVRQRREDRGWTEEDFERRDEFRGALKNGMKTAGLALAGGAVQAGSGGAVSLKSFINAPAEAIKELVANPDIPQIDERLGDALMSPIVQKATEFVGDFIDMMEEKTGYDIDDDLEEELADLVIDFVEDLAEDFFEDAGRNVLEKVKGFFKGWFQ